jgi:hypothetical protein
MRRPLEIIGSIVGFGTFLLTYGNRISNWLGFISLPSELEGALIAMSHIPIIFAWAALIVGLGCLGYLVHDSGGHRLALAGIVGIKTQAARAEPSHLIIFGLLAAVCVVGWQLYRGPKTITIPGPAPDPVVVRDRPSPEDIAVAAKPQLDELIRQRDAAVADAKRAAPTIETIGPITTLLLREELGFRRPFQQVFPGQVKPEEPIDSIWEILITTPPKHQDASEVIFQLIRFSGIGASRLDLPDPSNLDAPPIPAPSDRGVTLHGNDVLSQRLARLLGRCFNISTQTTLGGFKEFYASKLTAGRQFTWIEIGNGPVFKDDARCLR